MGKVSNDKNNNTQIAENDVSSSQTSVESNSSQPKQSLPEDANSASTNQDNTSSKNPDVGTNEEKQDTNLVVVPEESENHLDSKTKGGSNESSSFFGFSSIWGSKISSSLTIDNIVNQVKIGSQNLAQDCIEDFTDISQFLKSGVKVASQNINKGYQNLKQELEESKKSSPEVQIDERGIPIVAEKQDFDKVQENISEAAELINSSTASGIEAITNIASKLNKPSVVGEQNSGPGISEFLSEGKKDFENILSGIKGNFNKETIELQKKKISVFVQKIGTDLDQLTKKAISITSPDTDTKNTTNTFSLINVVELKNTESQKNYPIPLQGEAVIIQFNEFIKDYTHNKEVESVLEDKDVKKLYQSLVPKQISEVDFWTRYSFRIWQFDNENERKKKLVRELESANNDDDFDWDMDDDEKESTSIEIINAEEVRDKNSANGSSEVASENTKKKEKNSSNKHSKKKVEDNKDSDDSDSWE
ncbi:hypothetical protein AYI69_g4929 [Smittium culicis]|uniref:BSD domain-containing protein n=1 Tax=Smittium culicis TaxID=133412 RepID=A0A1R1XP25_9FUNG|nr:hypothetical protein AYI69_g7858 [Smittium culicis]OMJ23558.1 hypothetical protein AYI69_g4929 [Smittium culicis]